MLAIRRILLPTDFSPTATRALTRSLYLAERFGAELHLMHAIILHADDPHDPSHHSPSADETFGGADLAGLTTDYRGRPVALKQAQRRGFSAAEAILEYAEEEDVDLIVMGTHGRRGLRRLLLGSVAREVVCLARCPVLTLRGEDGGRAAQGWDRILVPLDVSAHSPRLLSYAAELARLYGASLDLLHVIEDYPLPYFYGPLAVDPGERLQDLSEKAKSALADLAREAGCGDLTVATHVASGQAADAIVRFATERRADLIVIATHGLTGLERTLVGSTAEAVVRTALCPVWTWKSFGKDLDSGRAIPAASADPRS